MTDRTELERQIAELQAQLAALDAEPLLIEARECAAKIYDGDGMILTANSIRMGHEDEVANGGRSVAIALAALRRGMELAPRAVMDDAAVEALRNAKWLLEGIKRAGWVTSPSYVDDINFGLERINNTLTLFRVPAAAWPEPDWINWRGGECPVPAGTRVALKFSGGGLQRSTEGVHWNWEHHEGDPTNIIAYRILGEQA